MIELVAGRYYAGMWVGELPVNQFGQSGNLLGCFWRELPNGPWTLQYRFRYYVDMKIHDSDDERSWYQGTLPTTMDEESVRQIFETSINELFAEFGGKPVIWIPIKGDDQVALSVLRSGHASAFFSIKEESVKPQEET